MIVEQPEHLRAWLSQVLQPLCDADPFALAKYVIALVKKDRDETELRNSMREQLDVFLQTQTEPFVNRLFAVLKSKEYLPNTETKPTEVLEIDSGASSDIAESEPSVSGHVSDDLSSAGSHKSIVPPTATMANKSGSKKEEDDRDRTRSRRKITNRSPPHRDGARPYPSSSESSRYSGSENDHKFTRSWADRNQRRPPIRARRRSRSRPRTRRHRHDYGSRSRSPVYPYSDSSSSKQKDAGGSQKGGRDSKDTSSTSVAAVTTKSGTSKHESGGEEPGPGPPGSTTGRCRDYDEKGLCMRGDLCPYDHGVNPVVLEEAVKGDYHRMQVEMQQEGFPSRIVRVGPSGYGEGVGHPWSPHGYGPRVFMDGRGPRGPPMVQYPSPPVVPRLLVDIPVMGVPSPQGHEMMAMDMPLRGMPRGVHPGRGYYMGGRGRGRGGFDRARLGMKTLMKINCSLQVKKIPIESNNIMALNGHFCKFGKIINIQINFENDPEAALVTFSSPEEAFRAYKSTEAVLNNRFIRVYWHNKEKENEDSDGAGAAGRVSVKDRLGEPADLTSDKSGDEGKIFPPGEGFPNQNFPAGIKKDPTTERLEKVEAIKKSQEMLAAQETLRKALEEKKKETLKLMNNLKIRKRDILKEHIEHQKKLITKLETEGSTMPPEEKEELYELMETLQNTIEKIKSDLDGTAPPAPESTDAGVAVAASQRDVLDAELDLYSRDQDASHSHPSELKRKVGAGPGGLRPKVPAKRGRGGVFRNSHVGGYHVHAMDSSLNLRSVDRRTTMICVSGVDLSRYDEILIHFKKYGTITMSEPLLDQSAVKLTFSHRKEAELAKSNGKVFAGRALDIQWVDKPSPEKKYASLDASNGSNSQPDEVEDTRNCNSDAEDTETTETDTSRSGGLGLDQLYDHEEEEEHDGERSWRR